MDVVGGLVAAVDALCAVEPAVVAGESLVALHREWERLGAVLTRATAAFDAGGAWAADGARSSSSFAGGSLPAAAGDGPAAGAAGS